MCISVDVCFHYSWVYTMDGISVSYDNSVFNLLKNCQIVLQSPCTISHNHQQCVRVQYFSTSLPTLLFVVLVGKLCPDLLATHWTVARQAPLSMGFPKQEYWSGLLFPFPGNLSNQRWNLCLLCLLRWQVDSLPLRHLGSPALLLTVFDYRHPSVCEVVCHCGFYLHFVE